MTKKGQSILGTAFFMASTAAFTLPFATTLAPAALLTTLTASYIAAELGQWQFRKVFGKKPAAPAPQA